MKKYIRDYKEYIKKIRNLELEKLNDDEKDELLKTLKDQIEFIQHERLVHLIVTAFISVILVIFIISAYVLTNMAMVLASVILLVLECFYLHHYYFLENHTQLLYDDYNTIYSRLKKTRVPSFVKNNSKR